MIVITGASDGLGMAVAQLYFRKEHVINISRHESPFADQNIVADLTNEDDINRVVSTLKHYKNDINTFIHCAGVLSLAGINEMTKAEIDRVFSINICAPLLMNSLLIDRFKGDHTDIVCVGSITSFDTHAGQTAYNVSKHAFKAMTDGLRLELYDTECRVVGVYPAMLETNMSQKIPDKIYPKSKKPGISPKDVASVIKSSLDVSKNMEVSDIVIRRKILHNTLGENNTKVEII